MDPDALAIDDFNKKVMEDKRVENVILPIRDGIMLIQKEIIKVSFLIRFPKRVWCGH